MTQAGRRDRTAAADRLCRLALDGSVPEAHRDGVTGLALVAVGGYGRGELAPCSDLDVVLVHDAGAGPDDVRRVAERVWYPLWDAGERLDHSVRALGEVTAAAADDPRVALGLLDARHLAGDPSVTLRLRADLLAHWRRDARHRLPALRELVVQRAARHGELAHAAVPDLKESTGGLRDATVLQALVATWLVDVPHADLERARLRLLDVRDVLHVVAGRATDRVAPELWPEIADRLGLDGGEAAQRHVRELGRRITHLSRLTWRRVDAVLAPPAPGPRAPQLCRIGPGVAVSGAEVVLDSSARPARDPLLLVRAAAEAAERRLALSPATAARLTRHGQALTEPWGRAARDLVVRLLAAGPGLVDVWETLEETGALDRLLPEWRAVRGLPHASVVHRFTVDRHLVETCVEASRLVRRVRRVDVLMTAALLHDVGKAAATDHSVAGEPVAAAVARRMGFDDRGTALVATLVRRHLLLADVATTRDLEDPVTVAAVTSVVPDVETLDLLEALTEADSRATSAQAWTPWRAGLVADLAGRVRAALATGAAAPGPAVRPRVPVPERVRRDAGLVDVQVCREGDGSVVTVVAGDRVGLMADVAGALAVLRASVRSARAWEEEDVAVSRWEVDDPDLDATALRQRLDAVAAHRLDPARRLGSPRGPGPGPSVQVRHDASRDATVLEVRVHDRRGVAHLACAALAGLTLSVRSAHLDVRGPQTVAVLYVQEPAAGALSEERSASAAHAVRRALGPPVTLDADRG